MVSDPPLQPMKISKRIAVCRSYEGPNSEPVLDLGSTPLADRLLSSENSTQPEPKVPLEVVFCSDCALVQITEYEDQL
jgi:hypothetical protein